MNKIKEITVSEHTVEERLFTYCYYIGESRRESGTSIRNAAAMQASTDDHIQISAHIGTAMDEIVNIIANYLPKLQHIVHIDTSHEGYKKYILRFSLPHYYPENVTDELTRTIESYAVMRAVSLWMLQQKPDEAVLAATEAEKLSIELRRLLGRREKPERTKERNCKNIEI